LLSGGYGYNAPEGQKVGNIEDVKNITRAGGTKQKTVQIEKSYD